MGEALPASKVNGNTSATGHNYVTIQGNGWATGMLAFLTNSFVNKRVFVLQRFSTLRIRDNKSC